MQQIMCHIPHSAAKHSLPWAVIHHPHQLGSTQISLGPQNYSIHAHTARSGCVAVNHLLEVKLCLQAISESAYCTQGHQKCQRG